jgi:quercetin dioxygenase-like cupin family protein
VCPCPHWGIVTEGRMTVRYADHEEVVSAGDVFFMAPGHVPEYEPGTRLIQFSPTDEVRVVTETIMRNQQALQGS